MCLKNAAYFLVARIYKMNFEGCFVMCICMCEYRLLKVNRGETKISGL